MPTMPRVSRRRSPHLQKEAYPTSGKRQWLMNAVAAGNRTKF
jgi:hypothetical protein